MTRDPAPTQADLQADEPPSSVLQVPPGPVLNAATPIAAPLTLFTSPHFARLPPLELRFPVGVRRCVEGGWVEWGCGVDRGGWRGQARAPRSCLGPVNGGGGWRRPPSPCEAARGSTGAPACAVCLRPNTHSNERHTSQLLRHTTRWDIYEEGSGTHPGYYP